MPSQNRFDAIALLKADHRKVEDLFAQFEAAKGAAKKQALVQNICIELSAHTVIEEEIFYPACRGKVEEGLLNEGYVEHDGSKVLVAELIASAPNEEFYDAKVKVLSEQIEHHVHEEEKRSEGIFSQARAAGIDMDELGERLMARKEAILAAGCRATEVADHRHRLLLRTRSERPRDSDPGTYDQEFAPVHHHLIVGNQLDENTLLSVERPAAALNLA